MLGGKTLISIIIPIYNNEDTLATCLNSVMQSSRDFEVILVNNGSTDSSVEICESYREKDSRIMVVHMDHDNPAHVYNNGLFAANGRYVHFIDPHDYLEDGAIDAVANLLLQNTDVVFLESSTDHPNFWDISHNNALRRLCRAVPDKVWDKLIRRELLLENDIIFTDGIIWEEVDFCMKLYLYAKTYDAIDFTYYHHSKKAPVSPSNQIDDNEELFGKIILTLSKWAGPAESTYQDYSTFIHSWMSLMYCDIIVPLYSTLSPNTRNIYKPGMEDFRWLLEHSHKSRTIKILYMIFGPFITSKLIQYKNRYISPAKSSGIIDIVHKKVNFISTDSRANVRR